MRALHTRDLWTEFSSSKSNEIDDVSAITLKSERELPKPTNDGAKIDDVSAITLKSDKELSKPTDVGAKIDDSAKTDSAAK